MKQWLIYKHTSERSGKSYIGLTSRTMEARWKEHCGNANRGSDNHFHKALRLYGYENWLHEIIADSIDTFEEACQLEKFYIKKFNTFENGYNSTVSGEFMGANTTDEEKLNIMTAAARKRYNKDIQEFWCYTTNTKIVGISGDVEKLLNLPIGSLSSVSTGNSKSRKNISLYSTYLSGYTPNSIHYEFEHADHGVIKTTISGLCESYTELRYSNVHALATCLDKTYKGWTLKGNQHFLCKVGLDPKSVRVKLIDVDTNCISEFRSLGEASRYTGIHRHSIRDAALNKRTVQNYRVEIERG